MERHVNRLLCCWLSKGPGRLQNAVWTGLVTGVMGSIIATVASVGMASDSSQCPNTEVHDPSLVIVASLTRRTPPSSSRERAAHLVTP